MVSDQGDWSSLVDEPDGDDVVMLNDTTAATRLVQPTKPRRLSISSLRPQTNIRHYIHFNDRIENALRQWGLQSVYIFLANYVSLIRERKRVAIFQDHFAAALAALFHLLPMIGTIVLAYFVFHEYYIGGELAGAPGYDKEKFLALQFAAKLHELFMLASLSVIIFTMVRHELALGQGVPFGSLSAGLQISDIGFFWSKEFLAICTANFSKFWKKVVFIATITLCTVLGVAVAPASATVMQPILDFWPAGGTDIWFNSTVEQIFPSILDESHTLGSVCALSGNDACPSAQWQTLTGEFLSQLPRANMVVNGLTSRAPTSLNIRGRDATLTLSVDVRAPVYDSYTLNYSVACIPHITVADSAVLNSEFWDLAARESTAHQEYRFFYRSGESYNIWAPSPTTHARCQPSTQKSGSLIHPIFPDFRDLQFPPVTINDTNSQNWIASILPNIVRPELFWFDLPTTFANNASIGALIAMPNNQTNSSVQIWGCMIDARWVDMIVNSDRIARVASGQPQGFHITGATAAGSWLTWQDYGSRATIRPSFAQYLNPRILSSNSTVFEEMAIASGIWNAETLQGSGSASHIEAILNLMITNGMARTAPYITQQGDIINFHNGTGPWWRGFMPIPPNVFGPGGNAYDVSPEQQESFYRLHMNVMSRGYAYSWSSTAVRFSMIILLTYVSAAAIFVTLSVLSGVTSSSWETASELMVLALRSPPPADMKNTAAGFSTIQSLRATYCVVADGDQVQLRSIEMEVPEKNRVFPNHIYG